MIQTLLIAAIILAAFWLERKYYIDNWQDDLDVHLKFLYSEIPEHGEGKLQLIVENHKKLPLPALMVKFQTNKQLEFEQKKGSVTTDQFYHNDVFQVSGGERVTRTLSFYAKKRGYYRINNVDLTCSDLLMSCELHASFQPSECVYVLPIPFESRDFQMMLSQLNGEMLTKRNLYEDPFEIRGIREYQPFDSMKSINWKATAKTGAFMVNQKNYTSPKTVRVFLNMEDGHARKNEDFQEYTISLTAGLVKFLMGQGIKVAFYCNGVDSETGDPTLKAPGKGPNHESMIMRSMARLSVEKPPQSFNKLFRRRILTEQENTYTCFVSATYTDDFLDTLMEYAKQGRNFSWFTPYTPYFETDNLPPILRPYFKEIRM